MSTMYGTTASNTMFGTASGFTMYGTTTASGNLVVPYATFPQLSTGDDLQAWVESKHGIDQNGDGAYDIGVITSNTSPATGIEPTGNDTTDYDDWAIFQFPNHGAATRVGDTITYTPSQGYVGLDAIGYALIKDGEPVAMATIFVGVYGAQPPATELPSYRDIPAIEAFMDQVTEVSLSQFTNIGNVAFTHRVAQALDINASINGSVLRLNPVTPDHGVGVGKVIIEMVGSDGTTVYDRKIITIRKVLDDSYVQAEITLEINDEQVDSWVCEAYAPDIIAKQITGSYGGIVHNNEPIKVVVYVRRLDGNTTVTKTTIVGGVVIKEIV